MIWLSSTMLTTFAGSRGNLEPDGGGCPRKWAYAYIAKIPRVQGAGATLGQEVQDEQVDPYLRDGRWFDFTKKSGEIAVALAPLLPAPKTVDVRQKFWMPMREEYGYVGELDVWSPRSEVAPGVESGAVLVGDVKTTSDLKWALGDDDLARDVQAVTYAAHAVLQRSADVVDLVWWYARTRKPHRVQRSRRRMTADEVMVAFDRVDALGKVVAKLKVLGPAPEQMPINVRTCDAYGGCTYRDRCNLSPAAVHAGVMEGYAMGNAQSMLNQFMNNGGAAPSQPAMPAPGTTPGSHAWYVQAAVDEGLVGPVVVAREGVEGAWVKLQTLAPAGWFKEKQALLAPPTATLPAGAPGPSPSATASFLDSIRMPGGMAAQGLPVPPAVNPPESLLPPAPAVGAVAAPATPAAPKATRGPNKPKAEADSGTGPTDVAALAALMRANGIRQICFDGAQITKMEIAKHSEVA